MVRLYVRLYVVRELESISTQPAGWRGDVWKCQRLEMIWVFGEAFGAVSEGCHQPMTLSQQSFTSHPWITMVSSQNVPPYKYPVPSYTVNPRRYSEPDCYTSPLPSLQPMEQQCIPQRSVWWQNGERFSCNVNSPPLFSYESLCGAALQALYLHSDPQSAIKLSW